MPDYDVAIPVEVIDISPDMRLGGPNFANLNHTYTLELFHADAGDDPLDHWNINWGDGSTATTLPGDATTATHVYTTLAGSQTIQVSAVEADTNLVWPNPASPTQTIDYPISVIPAVPDAPTAMTINPQSRDKIQLAWAMPTDTDASGYHLQISSDGVNFTPFTTITQGAARNYLATGLSANTNYSFSLSAYNDNGDSDYAYTSIASTTNDAWEDVDTVTPTPSPDVSPAWFTPLTGQGDGDYFNYGNYQFLYAGGGYENDAPPYNAWVTGNFRIQDPTGYTVDSSLGGVTADTLEQAEHDMYAYDGHPMIAAGNEKIGVYIGDNNPGPGVSWSLQRRLPHVGITTLNDTTKEGDTAPISPYDPDDRAKLWFSRDDRLIEALTVHFTFTPSQYLTTEDYSAIAKIPDGQGNFSEVAIDLASGTLTIPAAEWDDQLTGLEVDITATDDTTPEWTEDFSLRLDDDANYVADHPNDNDGYDADGANGDVDPDAKIELVDDDLGITLGAANMIGSVTGKEHLVPLDLDFPADVKTGATITLSTSMGSGKVRVWDTPTPGPDTEPLIDIDESSITWNSGENIPRTLYVGATDGSDSIDDFGFYLDDTDQNATPQPRACTTNDEPSNKATSRMVILTFRGSAVGSKESGGPTPGNVMVGDDIPLSATYRGPALPAGTVPTYNWTIDGTTFRDYFLDSNAATITRLTAADLAKDSLDFFWTDPGSKQVKIDLTVPGFSLSETTQADVLKPTTTVSAQTDQVVLINKGTASGGRGISQVPDDWLVQAGGVARQGFELTANVTMPSNWTGGQGQWAFLQVLEGYTYLYYADGTTIAHWSLEGGSRVDGGWPPPASNIKDARTGASPGTNVFNTGTGTYTFSDSPAYDLSNPFEVFSAGLNQDVSTWPIGVSLDDTFHTYVMFQPPNGWWVPVKEIDWTVSFSAYKGIAGNPKGWYLGAYSNPIASAPMDVANPPIWAGKWQNGRWEGP